MATMMESTPMTKLLSVHINHFIMKWLNMVVIVLLSACSDSENLSTLKQKSLIYCSESSPESFNPQTSLDSATIDATSNQLYDRLLTIDPNTNTLMPAIAKSWHVTNDGKIITFYLRKDIEFHHTDYFTPTRNLNAFDVIFSFTRIIDNEHPFHFSLTGQYPYFDRAKFGQNIVRLEKINDHTIRFLLHEADTSFLSKLASQYAVILSAEYASQLAKNLEHKLIDTQPIGTGPYKFKEYRIGSFIRYYRNEKYWQEPPEMEQLVYDITTSNTGRLTKLMTEECDIIAAPIGHQKVIEHKKLTLESNTSLDVAFIALNTIKPPFNNPLVRQAVALAIDKEAIINTVYLGHGVQAYSLLPPISWAYNAGGSNNAPYNITRALELMSESGYEEGTEINLWANAEATSYNPNALTMALIIKENLKSIGVKVNIIKAEPENIFDLENASHYHAYIDGWSATHPDPDNFFTPLLSCAANDIGNNRAFWCDPDFDDLLAQGRQAEELSVRQYFYDQATRILASEMPIIPIAHSKTYMARNNQVTGKFFSSFGVDFRHVSKK